MAFNKSKMTKGKKMVAEVNKALKRSSFPFKRSEGLHNEVRAWRNKNTGVNSNKALSESKKIHRGYSKKSK